MSVFYKSILTLFLAIISFNFMTVCVKILGNSYPVLELSFFRNIFGFLPIMFIIYFSKEINKSNIQINKKYNILCAIRGFSVTFAQFCFYLSLTKLEYATANTLAFSGPFFVTLLSIPILGHVIGFWRWSAVLLGFAGVIFIMKPGADIFTVYSLFPIGAAFGYALSSVLVKTFERSIPSIIIQLYTQFYCLLGSIILMLLFVDIKPVQNLNDFFFLILIGITGSIGVFCLISSYRKMKPSNLAPFEYIGIPTSFFLGWIFFSEAPFDQLFPGVLLIVSAGFLIIWRERKKGLA